MRPNDCLENRTLSFLGGSAPAPAPASGTGTLPAVVGFVPIVPGRTSGQTPSPIQGEGSPVLPSVGPGSGSVVSITQGSDVSSQSVSTSTPVIRSRRTVSWGILPDLQRTLSEEDSRRQSAPPSVQTGVQSSESLVKIEYKLAKHKYRKAEKAHKQAGFEYSKALWPANNASTEEICQREKELRLAEYRFNEAKRDLNSIIRQIAEQRAGFSHSI